MLTDLELKIKSIAYRRTILRIIKQARAGHTGGDLSAVDILNVLYNNVLNVSPATLTDPNRDRYVQSKGHCVEALYTVLADRGFFPAEELDTLGRYGSHWIGHPTRGVPGIEQNTGALGHGLAVAVGMALAAKLDGRGYRVYTLLGDGELAEGSVWEASLAAAHYRLDNLVVIVDRNGLQITGPPETVMALAPLEEKFAAFGYAVREVDGNDMQALMALFGRCRLSPASPTWCWRTRSRARGSVSWRARRPWHHRVPTDEEYEAPCVSWTSRERVKGDDMAMGRANLEVFADTLLEIARAGSRCVGGYQRLARVGKLTRFAETLPDQLVEVGIAEQNVIGIAAGLASAGKNVFAVSPACFVTARAFEQIKNDVAYSDQPVRIIGISAGVSYGALGATHHSLHDYRRVARRA